MKTFLEAYGLDEDVSGEVEGKRQNVQRVTRMFRERDDKRKQE